MRVALLCLLLVTVLSVDARKSFSTRRKSGGNSRRGGQTSQKHPAPAPATPHRTDSGSSSTFLNSERAGSSGSSVTGSSNTHYRGNPFDNGKQHQHQPSAPQPAVPHQTSGPIGFEKVQGQGGQKIGFDKVNSEVQHKPASASVPSAPAYPGSPGASYPGKASAPNGPPPSYPGQGPAGSGSHGGYEPPPAYPGRPVNAPPVYSPNTPNYPQKSPAVGGYPQQNSPYPQQNSPYQHQSNPYPQQNNPYPQQQWSQSGQQNYGYPGTGSNVGNFPNQGYQQGYGSYPNGGGFGGYGNNHMGGGGYGQSYPGYGGNSYGGSPFGQSNSYGGSPFQSFGGGGFGGFGAGNSYGGYGNQGYSPNNFGYSSKPGLFGSLFGGGGGHYNSPYGYHKRSRFGGLPIPIPIPIPIPLGMFGGRSHNHRVVETFIKNQTINESDNSTAVYILNNATFTPCTTDQFIYDSLNVTVMSCTAENCTAIKVFTTTNVSGTRTVRSAGITMCMEDDTTYSSFADNVNPTVQDLHKYLMRVCKDVVVTDTTGTTAEETSQNVSVKITQTVFDEGLASAGVTTTEESAQTLPTRQPEESSTIRTLVDSTSSSTNTSECEVFNCSRIEMCLPTIEIADHCATPDCPFTRTGYQPCVTVKMCKSATTPISTFATLNNTLSRIDQFNNVTSVNDVANLTLVSYLPPPALPVNSSCANSSCPLLESSVAPQGTVTPEGASVVSVLPEECVPGQLIQSADGTTSSSLCSPQQEAGVTSVPSADEMTSSQATTVIG